MEDWATFILKLALVWAVVFVWFGIPGRMAQARGRNPGHWMLVSMFGTPVLAIVLLLAQVKQPASDAQRSCTRPDASPRLCDTCPAFAPA